ncbi:MAG: DEAD/DEAH box helicase family protein [Chloroflexota bacterium]|nr:DEAD/DEAH box helicase family protein [Chloroflexota bacterium]
MAIDEAAFETTIVEALLQEESETAESHRLRERGIPYHAGLIPGGYRQRSTHPGDAHYDEEFCLDAQLLVEFVTASQPQAWAELKKHYGADRVRDEFVHLVAREIERHGTLHVLRQGVRTMGQHIRLIYFPPASGLNPELQRLYELNQFSVIRQWAYSVKDRDVDWQHRKRLDLGIFVNGLPLFTAELKNPLTGQRYQHAIRQYKRTRSDPQEPLFDPLRCLAHFAVDPDEVWFTTELRGDDTRFFPFNRGRGLGAGNPVPDHDAFATRYLWEEIWAKDSVLELIRSFIYVVAERDDEGRRKKNGEHVIFPRYHQRQCVRRLVRHAREHGAGQRYLIQHSAGSGKSYTISWLAHQLASLHDEEDEPVFDSIVVITDRRVLDRQLQRHVKAFEQVRGLVQHIRGTSQDLRRALEKGKRIIVSTIQKFPFISDEIAELPGQRFAVIIDEAHSSQGGEQSRHLKSVLAADSLAQAAAEEDIELPDAQDLLVEQARIRGRQPNVSFFAFTATPKEKTLELFGTQQPDGSYRPFHLYSMRQAIEEGVILDVLKHYTTYKAYWTLHKTIEGDPRYDRKKASATLRRAVEMEEEAITAKLEVILEHFQTHVAHMLDGRSLAMIITPSRLHAVRYRLALDRLLRERHLPYKALVAFSGTVRDRETGRSYTEAGMNGVPQSQTAEIFREPGYRFLVVANKFQTGYDEKLLCAMYVDKKLGGVRAVQTLSRLNRPVPGEYKEAYVLDFANDAEVIQAAFADYYETTLLTEATDPHLLYDLLNSLSSAGFFTMAEVTKVGELLVTDGSESEEHVHPRVHNILRDVVERFVEADEADQEAFRDYLRDYVRLYAFLGQIVSFTDADLEALYLFGRLLLGVLPWAGTSWPRELLEQVDVAAYDVQQTYDGSLSLKPEGELEPQKKKGPKQPEEEELVPLSDIIALLNERFGLETSNEEASRFLEQLEERLGEQENLARAMEINSPENARLAFEHSLNDSVQDMLDVNFKFYKMFCDDHDFAQFLTEALFARYRQQIESQSAVSQEHAGSLS